MVVRAPLPVLLNVRLRQLPAHGDDGRVVREPEDGDAVGSDVRRRHKAGEGADDGNDAAQGDFPIFLSCAVFFTGKP